MLGRNHVVIVIAGKVRVHALAGLRGASMANAVGQDDVVLRGVEQLAGLEEDVGELGAEELRSGAAGTVQDKHCVRHTTTGVALRLTERAVMEAEFVEGFSCAEFEVVSSVIALLDRQGEFWLLGVGWQECSDNQK